MDIDEWLTQLKDGNATIAHQQIWDEYFARLVGLAKGKLRDVPTHFHNEEDIALSAMKSFFIRARDDRFPDLSDSSDLWPLLVTITLRKVLNLKRHQFAEMRDVRRNRNIEDVLTQQPTQEVADQVLETTNQMLESLDDPQRRQIAVLKMEGYTNKEIAKEIGKSHKTVEWKLRLIRKQLSETLFNENDDE